MSTCTHLFHVSNKAYSSVERMPCWAEDFVFIHVKDEIRELARLKVLLIKNNGQDFGLRMLQSKYIKVGVHKLYKHKFKFLKGSWQGASGTYPVIYGNVRYMCKCMLFFALVLRLCPSTFL